MDASFYASRSGSFERVSYDSTLEFRHPNLAAALAYWRRCCAGRALPQRSDLDPVLMRSFIAHVGLIEVRHDDKGDMAPFVRIAGSRIDEVFGWRGGQMLTDNLPLALAQGWRAQFDAALGLGAPLRVGARIVYDIKTSLDVESLYAPLGASANSPSIVFYGFAVLKMRSRIEADRVCC
jgi:hypothetical protein